MNIDTNTIISMTEANQNFSKLIRTVDKYGQAIIFKNNAPQYIVRGFPNPETTEYASVSEALASAHKIMSIYDKALQELAR
ncbi:MAG: type II toxin-antitoxin system Phd/YefM family antitoxin [Selenomonadaceae bacterium]|nr:type II toxin-antitoxin system Phd/YefM family antitoxin [Selenomonadaceae bacterium]